jgi:hypothetical protein
LTNPVSRMDPYLCIQKNGLHYCQNQQSGFRGTSIV